MFYKKKNVFSPVILYNLSLIRAMVDLSDLLPVPRTHCKCENVLNGSVEQKLIGLCHLLDEMSHE